MLPVTLNILQGFTSEIFYNFIIFPDHTLFFQGLICRFAGLATKQTRSICNGPFQTNHPEN